MRLSAAGAQIRKRGGLLLITARFIPGGRTVLTLSSGITQQPRAWFMTWIAIACTLWAAYAATLGYLFGQAFEDDHAIAFWLAFGTALSITAIVELIRWARDRGGEPEIAPAADADRTLGG
jgi:membrane protein DedA with SNARE-associated domain